MPPAPAWSACRPGRRPRRPCPVSALVHGHHLERSCLPSLCIWHWPPSPELKRMDEPMRTRSEAHARCSGPELRVMGSCGRGLMRSIMCPTRTEANNAIPHPLAALQAPLSTVRRSMAPPERRARAPTAPPAWRARAPTAPPAWRVSLFPPRSNPSLVSAARS